MDDTSDLACESEVTIIDQVLLLWLHCVHIIVSSCL